jgi:polyhydroxybutyrate depolymerase
MARDRRIKIQVGRQMRRFMVHLPSTYDGRTPMPVVIMLHGGGATGRSAALETGWSNLADQAGFLAVFPDALPRDPSRLASFPGQSAVVERWVEPLLLRPGRTG